jgi:5-methylcytosine-specific restriction protein A
LYFPCFFFVFSLFFSCFFLVFFLYGARASQTLQWKVREGIEMALLKMCRCGKIIPQALEMCPECAQHAADRHKEYNATRRNKRAYAFYTSAEWRKARALRLQHAGGLDLYALYVDGVIQYAEMVHHIVPLSEDWSKRCEQRNLFPLTNANHNKIEALYDSSIAEKKQTQQLLRRLLERFEAEQRGVRGKFGAPRG